MKTSLPFSLALAITTVKPAGAEPVRTILPGTNGEPALSLLHQAGDGSSVVYVHGATFPAALSVAYRIAERSWMDDLHSRGLDVWAFDLAGYGQSQRPPAFAEESASAPPYGRSEVAARQLERVVDEIRRMRPTKTVDIIAHSWGTLPAQRFAAEHPGAVRRLVLFGPIAPRREPAGAALSGAAILLTATDQRQSFSADGPNGEPDLTDSDMRGWEAAYLASDPNAFSRTPAAVRTPAGPAADINDVWSGRYAFETGRIRAPILLIRGSRDTISSKADLDVLARLAQPGVATAETVPDGGHRMHLERNRQRLFDRVGVFLTSPEVSATGAR